MAYKNLNDDYGNSFATLNASLNGELTTFVDQSSADIGVGSTVTMNEDKYLWFVKTGSVYSTNTEGIKAYAPGILIAPDQMKLISGSGVLEFQKGGLVHMTWFGTDDVALQAAINALDAAGGGVVLIPEIEVSIPTGVTITCKSNVSLRGMGNGSKIATQGATTRSEPLLTLQGVNNLSIENLHFDSTTNTYGEIEISGTSNDITIRDCYFGSGYSGIVMKGTDDTEPLGDIQRITIFNNTFDSLTYPIILGELNEATEVALNSINIQSNHFNNSTLSAIYVRQGVTDLLLEGNIIHDSGQHGISLDASGQGVSILGNDISESTEHGIFVKPQVASTEESWRNAQKIVISANIIRENSKDGIRVDLGQEGLNISWPSLISISGNQIYKNTNYGIYCRGRQISILRNHLFENASSTILQCPVIFIDSLGVGYETEYINIVDNVIANNGVSTKNNIGIYIKKTASHVNIIGNMVSNDDNPTTGYLDYGIWVDDFTKDICLKNNQCVGFDEGKGIYIISGANGAEVKCETLSYLVGTIGNAANVEQPVLRADCNVCLISAFIINKEDADNNSDSHYINLYITKKDSAGTGTDDIFYFNTSLTAGAKLDKYKEVSMGAPVTLNKYLKKGDVIRFRKTSVGDGAPVNHMMLVLNYVTF